VASQESNFFIVQLIYYHLHHPQRESSPRSELTAYFPVNTIILALRTLLFFSATNITFPFHFKKHQHQKHLFLFRKLTPNQKMPEQKPAEYSDVPSMQVQPPSSPHPGPHNQYHSQQRASSSRNNTPRSRTSQRHGTRSCSARGDNSNSRLPNNPHYQPASIARYENTLSPISEQVPERITSFLPPDAPLPSGQRPMTPREAHDLCQELVRRFVISALLNGLRRLTSTIGYG